MFRKLDLYPSSGEGRDTYSVGSLRKNHWRLALWKGPSRVDVSPVTSGRKQIQFPKRCVLWFLDYRTMGKVQKSSNSECYTRYPEPSRINRIYRLNSVRENLKMILSREM
jgi:hypothetical protein